MMNRHNAAAFVYMPCTKTGESKKVLVSKLADESIDVNMLESLEMHNYSKRAILPKLTNDALIHMSKRQIGSSDIELLRDILREITERLNEEEMLKRFVKEHSW